MLDDVLVLGTGWMATRWAGLAGRPRARRQVMRLVAHRADELPGPLIAEQVMGSGKPGFVPALDALTDYPIRDRLSEIQCPVLVVWGEKDRLVPVKDAYVFGELIPDVRVEAWSDTGHVAMLERPGGVFVHLGVHPCFCGGFADRGDPEAVVIRRGYLDSDWTRNSWTDQGIRDKVGAQHRPLPDLLHLVQDAGLAFDRFAEGGAPTPITFAIRAHRPYPR